MKEHRLDCMHEVCPVPMIKVLKKLEQMKIGDILIVETDNGASVINIKEWTEKNEQKMDYIETKKGEWEIYIEKVKEF